MSEAAARPIRTYLLDLQDAITGALERDDGEARFREEVADRPGGGMVRPRVLSDGPVFERAAVNFSHTKKDRLPAAATERRADLIGRSFEAVSLSLIVHPRNPFVPTAHMNVRFFVARKAETDSVWWFGGGLDLTPYYAFREDVVHWHRAVRAACDPFGEHLYRRFKKACDDYFFLPHRGEARGVGGLFFDDFDEGDFEQCFALARSVGDSFLPAYLPIVQRRKDLPSGERERDFQLYRRGRYVEFNLLYDRGTRFGLQSGAQIESILASMPPLVRWRYDWQPEPGSEEARLYEQFLKPRDWLDET